MKKKSSTAESNKSASNGLRDANAMKVFDENTMKVSEHLKVSRFSILVCYYNLVKFYCINCYVFYCFHKMNMLVFLFIFYNCSFY